MSHLSQIKNLFQLIISEKELKVSSPTTTTTSMSSGLFQALNTLDISNETLDGIYTVPNDKKGHNESLLPFHQKGY